MYRLAALLVALLAAELTFRLLTLDGTLFGEPLPPFGAINTERQASWLARLRSEEPFKLAAFDPELGWEWKPGAADDAGMVHINSIGARGTREYAPTPPDGVTRLAFFGDSFTFCDEMPDESSFQHYLETRNDELEALNFGVNGYGTDQALLRFRRRGRDLGARVVFIGILVENIGRNANRLRPLWNPKSGFAFPKPRFRVEDDELVLVPQPFASREALVAAFDDGSLLERVTEHEHWLACPDLGFVSCSRLAQVAALPFAHRARDPLALWDSDSEPLETTLAVLKTFREEALAAGAERAPVLLFPSWEDLATLREKGPEAWEPIPDAVTSLGLEMIDLTGPLLERQRELDQNPQAGTLHYKGHHSTVGNDVVARVIEQWLLENRIL